eukprot:scaffold26005_cov38-Phaeocystis_antarctica.AAC.1
MLVVLLKTRIKIKIAAPPAPPTSNGTHSACRMRAIADPGLEHCIVANVPCHIDSVFALIWTTVAHVLTWSVAALRFVGAAPRKLPLVLDGCCLCFGRRNIVLEHKIFVTVACNATSAGKWESPLGVQGALEAKSPDPLHERGFHLYSQTGRLSREGGESRRASRSRRSPPQQHLCTPRPTRPAQSTHSPTFVCCAGLEEVIAAQCFRPPRCSAMGRAPQFLSSRAVLPCENLTIVGAMSTDTRLLSTDSRLFRLTSPDHFFLAACGRSRGLS